MKATHKLAEEKYEALRQYARETAQLALPAVMMNNAGQAISVCGRLKLSEIGFNAKIKAQGWNRSPSRRVDWNWREGLPDYAWRNPKRFELAIWYDQNFLCGLGLGRPTWSDSRLRLDFIEASPVTTPLTGLIVDIVVTAATIYCDVIGATQLRIMNPINEKVKDHYLKKHGFSFDQKGNFCVKELV